MPRPQTKHDSAAFLASRNIKGATVGAAPLRDSGQTMTYFVGYKPFYENLFLPLSLGLERGQDVI
jgi:hypothetical protein